MAEATRISWTRRPLARSTKRSRPSELAAMTWFEVRTGADVTAPAPARALGYVRGGGGPLEPGVAVDDRQRLRFEVWMARRRLGMRAGQLAPELGGQAHRSLLGQPGGEAARGAAQVVLQGFLLH